MALKLKHKNLPLIVIGDRFRQPGDNGIFFEGAPLEVVAMERAVGNLCPRRFEVNPPACNSSAGCYCISYRYAYEKDYYDRYICEFIRMLDDGTLKRILDDSIRQEEVDEDTWGNYPDELRRDDDADLQ